MAAGLSVLPDGAGLASAAPFSSPPVSSSFVWLAAAAAAAGQGCPGPPLFGGTWVELGGVGGLLTLLLLTLTMADRLNLS